MWRFCYGGDLIFMGFGGKWDRFLSTRLLFVTIVDDRLTEVLFRNLGFSWQKLLSG